MGLETGNYLDDLVVTNPIGSTDPKSQGDNHLRLIKTVAKNTFPGMAGRAWRFQDQSGNYNAVVTDNMSVINMTGANKTVNLPAVGTVGNGMMLLVLAASGSETVTLDAASTEVINGEETIVIDEGWTAILLCDGSEWVMIKIPYVGSLLGAQWLAFDQPNEDVPFSAAVLKTMPGWPQDCDLLAVVGAVVTEHTSGTLTYDIKVNGTSVMTTDKMDIDANENSTLTAGTPPALTTTEILQGDVVELSCTSLGSGGDPAGWIIYMLVAWK